MNYDRIILELLDRVSTLEEEVKWLKERNERIVKKETQGSSSKESSYGNKDTTKYILDGSRYGKNRLVLAVIQKYMLNNPETTAQQLMRVFDKSLQGSLGVVRIYEDVKTSYADSEKRFFMQPGEIVCTATEDCVVCTQWGAFNIDFFVARAEELGFSILKV